MFFSDLIRIKIFKLIRINTQKSLEFILTYESSINSKIILLPKSFVSEVSLLGILGDRLRGVQLFQSETIQLLIPFIKGDWADHRDIKNLTSLIDFILDL